MLRVLGVACAYEAEVNGRQCTRGPLGKYCRVLAAGLGRARGRPAVRTAELEAEARVLVQTQEDVVKHGRHR